MSKQLDEKSASRLLILLVQASHQILNENFGVDRLDGLFSQIVELLHEQPKIRTEFVKMCEETFLSRDAHGSSLPLAPRELIEYAGTSFGGMSSND